MSKDLLSTEQKKENYLAEYQPIDRENNKIIITLFEKHKKIILNKIIINQNNNNEKNEKLFIGKRFKNINNQEGKKALKIFRKKIEEIFKDFKDIGEYLFGLEFKTDEDLVEFIFLLSRFLEEKKRAKGFHKIVKKISSFITSILNIPYDNYDYEEDSNKSLILKYGIPDIFQENIEFPFSSDELYDIFGMLNTYLENKTFTEDYTHFIALNGFIDKIEYFKKDINIKILRYKLNINNDFEIKGNLAKYLLEGDFLNDISKLSLEKQKNISEIILQNPQLFFEKNKIKKGDLYNYLLGDLDIKKYIELKKLLENNKNLPEKMILSHLKGEKLIVESIAKKTGLEIKKVQNNEKEEPKIIYPEEKEKIILEDLMKELVGIFGENNGNILFTKLKNNIQKIKKVIKIGKLLIEGDKNLFTEKNLNFSEEYLENIFRILSLLKKNNYNNLIINEIFDIKKIENKYINYLYFIIKNKKGNLNPEDFKNSIFSFLKSHNYEKIKKEFGFEENEVDLEKEIKIKNIIHILDNINGPITKLKLINKLQDLGFSNILGSGGNHDKIHNTIYNFDISISGHGTNGEIGPGTVSKIKNQILNAFLMVI